MLDFAWSELLVVIAVAVLVIGPKDIPKMMQGLGRIMRRVHYLKYALSLQFEDMMKETELDEMRAFNKKAADHLPPDLADTDEAAADEAGQPPEIEPVNVEEDQDGENPNPSRTTTH